MSLPLRVVIIIIGIILGVIIAKLIAKQIIRKKPSMPQREATKRGLLTVAFVFLSFAFVFSVGKSIFSLCNPPQQYDIYEYIEEDLQIKPAVWHVTNGKNEVYMMGTIHATIRDKTFPLPDYVMEIYESCDKILVESYVPETNKAAASAAYKLPDGSKITDVISEDTYNSCKAFLTKRNAYYPELDGYNADFWQSLMMSVELLNVNGIDINTSIESYFKDLAEKDGKEIVAALDNESLNDTLSDELQDYLLLELAQNADKAAEDFSNVYTKWANGKVDFDNDEEIPPKLAKNYDEYKKTAIDDKNLVFAEKIIEMLENGDKVFVLFGAAHFGDDNGIISILREKEYNVEQIIN